MRLKKNIISIILLFFSLPFDAYSQQSVVDSLKKILNSDIPDSSRSLILDRLGLFTMTSKPQIALQFAQKGLLIAKKTGFPKGISRNLNRLGAIYRSIGNYPKSLEMHMEAKKIALECNDLEGLSSIYNQLGVFYSAQKDSKTAINSYMKGLNIAQSINNSNLKRIIFSNLGMDYTFLEKLDSAKIYTEAAYEMAMLQKSNNINVLLMNLGSLYRREKKYTQALDFYRKSIAYSKLVEDDGILSLTYFEMADIFKKTTMLDSSIIYSQKSLEVAESNNNPKNIFLSSTLLSELYDKIDTKKSYKFFKQAASAKDSMFSQEKFIQIQNIKFIDSIKEQELIAKAKEIKNEQRLILMLSIMGVFLLVALILFRSNQLKNKANILLKNQKEEIDIQKNKVENALSELKFTQNQLIQNEKLSSLSELTAGIAHEIQNPLNFVNNFSELSIDLSNELKEEIEKISFPENDKEYISEIISDLTQNQEKINLHGKRASSIVSSMLEHSRVSTGERQSTDINKLAEEYLKLSYHGMKAKKASFKVDFSFFPDLNLPSINIIPQDIGRVMFNIFSNAFYAAAQIENPEVKVFTKFNNKNLIIEVFDNGKGIPKENLHKIFQPFFTTKPTGEGTGLGLSLSYDIITKGNNGKIEVESTEGNGTTFSVFLPFDK